MVRVCKPGGRVTVCDVFTTSPEQGEAYDRLERYRDPSHTRALPLAELEALFSGLRDVRREFYKYPVEVEDLLSRAFPEPGGAEAFRQIVAADVGVNRLGIDASNEGGLRFAFPVVIFSGVKGLEKSAMIFGQFCPTPVSPKGFDGNVAAGLPAEDSDRPRL